MKMRYIFENLWTQHWLKYLEYYKQISIMDFHYHSPISPFGPLNAFVPGKPAVPFCPLSPLSIETNDFGLSNQVSKRSFY